MKSNIFLYFITWCMLSLFAMDCCAANLSVNEALYFAENQGEKLLMTFQEPDLVKRYKELDDIFVKHIDIDYVSKFVVGKHWRRMSEEQKKRYQDSFLRYGLAFYKTLPLDYAKDVTYQIKGVDVDGAFVNVVTNVSVNLGGDNPQNITLVFRLHKVGGIIKAVDVKIAESSLLLSYRGKFYEMIAQSDDEIDWFLDDLDDLVKTLEYGLKQNVATQQKYLEFDDKTI